MQVKRGDAPNYGDFISLDFDGVSGDLKAGPSGGLVVIAFHLLS